MKIRGKKVKHATNNGEVSIWSGFYFEGHDLHVTASRGFVRPSYVCLSIC